MCWKSVDLLFRTRNLITKLKPEHRISLTQLQIKLDEDISNANQVIFNRAVLVYKSGNSQELCEGSYRLIFLEGEPFLTVDMDVPETYFYLLVSYTLLNKPLDRFLEE